MQPAARRGLWSRMPLSLRCYVALLATVGAVGAGAAGTRIYRREAAIHRLESVGGIVDRAPAGPAWLRQWPGGEWVARAFEEVGQVDLRYSSVTDADLQSLEALAGIRYLLLDDAHITDEGLKYFAGLNRLKVLSLPGAPITDAGLVHLRRLPKLS